MTLKKIGIWCSAALIVYLLFSYASYHFERWWNYNRGYESQVTQTICELVKPDSLKNPERCRK
jgi:hypothetical protein